MENSGRHTYLFARRVFSVLLAVVLAAGLLPHPATVAFADDDDLAVGDIAAGVADAQAAVEEAELTLDEAEERMASLTEECEELNDEIDALQEQIDEMAASVLEAQAAMLEGRESLGKTAAYEYRSGGTASALSLLLSSESFGELLRNIAYLNAIADYQAQEVAAQEQLMTTFQNISSELSAQKDEQEAVLAQLDAKVAEAEELVESATASLSEATSEQDRIAELQAQAEALAAEGEVSEPVVVEEANTVDRKSVVSDDAEVQGDPSQEADGEDAQEADGADEEASGGSGSSGGSSSSSSSSSTSSGSSSTSSSFSASDGWQTGVASAYGGSTDPYTPNPGITATGAVCDDTSMGVAVPMSWENYWQYYGRTVEIYYNGTTVYATVNDCGYMGGGTRALDLQPGVWKAFGYTSCSAWGLRTVKYRFL